MKLLPLYLPEAPKWRCWQFISLKHQLYINALMRLKKKKKKKKSWGIIQALGTAYA